MARFLVEVPHENTKQACDRAVEAFKTAGSHFLVNADWGCLDDVHKAWVTIEVDSKEEALMILPPWYRREAIVITLQKLALEKLAESAKQHQV